jgi:PAS domain S-box-containing protein
MLNLDWHFFPVFARLDPATAYPGTYNLGLVVTSVAIAILAAFVALSISGRIVAATTARARYAWASAGAISMGGGIWSMHFVGMLAFSLPCGITYEPVGTLLSMIPGMLASGIALGTISKPHKPGLSRLSVSAVLMGVGIAAMHYSGMAAMRPEALLRYDPALVAISVVVAVVLAFVSLSIRFQFHRLQASPMAATIIAASVMGCAIAGMHYTAMQASIFFPLPDPPTYSMALSPTLLAVLITIFAVLIAVSTLVATFAGRQSELALSLSAEMSRRKRIEEDLRRSEAYLAEAQKITHTGSWAYDVANRRMTYSSEEHHRLFGFDPAAGMPGAGDWVQRIHPDDRETAIQTMEQTIRDRRDYELEHRVVHTDGTIKFVHTIGHPVFSSLGDLVEVVGTSTDITDRKREEYLTEQVSERLPDLVSIIGWDYRYRRANPTYERVWGIPAEKVLGMHVCDVVGRETFDRVVKPNLDRCFAGEEVSFAEWFDNPGGRKYWIVTYSPLKLESERVDAALAVARDLTEQTLASERLRDARIELAHVNRVATIGQLTTSIAHEVNQPIGALVINAHVALRMLGAEPPDLNQACEALEDIIKDGRRASDVIQRIRALVKKTPGQADLFDINEVIVETIALARSEILRNGVSLETQLGSGLPEVRGDRVQLQQVIMNLLMNAVEAMNAVNEGTRELQIATDKDRGDYVSITVSDSGPILQRESLDRFFEAFYSSKPTGMGIGLSICRSIIEAHEGRIWASANVPRGATLHVTLPAPGKTGCSSVRCTHPLRSRE